MSEFEVKGRITKASPAQRRAFGWAYISEVDGSPVIDKSGEHIAIEQLEPAAYRFMLHSRDGGEMHQTRGVGKMVESVVLTDEKIKAMGLSESTPRGWWVGFEYPESSPAWQKIKSGEYRSFSIHGTGRRKAA